MLLSFDGIAAPVSLVGCEDLIESFSPLLKGWRFTEAQGPPRPPVIAIRKIPEGYRVDALSVVGNPENYESYKYRDRCLTVCCFFAKLLMAYVCDSASQMCLHGAGLEIGGKLVVFPTSGKGGKSTLSVHLVAAGARLFSDDVVPLTGTDNTAVALGIAPRLRLPLSEQASPQFREFVRSHAALGDEQYQYVPPDDAYWAPLGEEAPVAALVALERLPRVHKAELLPATKSEGLRFAIGEYFGEKIAASEILRRLHEVVQAVPCYRLRYAEGEQAVRLLLHRFGGRSPSNGTAGYG